MKVLLAVKTERKRDKSNYPRASKILIFKKARSI